MPHIVIEYSANLESRLDVPGLVRAVHETAVGTGVFPLGGIRTRAARRDIYRVADGNPENAFVHMVARIASGRDLATRKRVGESLFATLCDRLTGVYDSTPLGISFEIQEIDPDTSWKKNNLHERLKAQGVVS